ncbi:MAG TPA: DUF3800 domain-containing protein [Candidatus Paceibacterota bacterium]|nr:DUF3800 domain-containing protein [Candidatus Paceibacterota bacterium]HRZ56299.1 DUF3800 domain-containing protein [Candidatus Paceibacterota bacterium]
MTDLFDIPADPEPSSSEVQHLFVDEAGTPTLFHESGKPIADTYGCSRFFILGKLEVENPAALATALTELRQKMLADPIFAGTESFKPERKKTALAFHAKDDLPEVRAPVFGLLRGFGSQLRFYAVVCDKLKLTAMEMARRAKEPGYRFNENSVYDALMRELFGKFHRLADRYEVNVARRGTSTRNEAIKVALAHAEQDFERKFGFRRSEPDAWKITVLRPKEAPCLQAVDYFLWALQRFYEVKWDAKTRKKALDPTTGLVIHEDRFLSAMWPQVGEVHDLHFGRAHRTFFTTREPLTLDRRFPPPKGKKKKS